MHSPRRSNASVLSSRSLNRALLARQQLIERAPIAPERLIERLVGMQAQSPRNPYIALWSRVAEFRPDQLERLVLERRAVRVPLLRTTLHLVTAADALALRPLVQPVLERTFRTSTPWRHVVDEIDVEELLGVGRRLVEERPRTTKELGTLLAEHFPDRDPTALSQAVRYLLPMVQVPPRGLWARSGQPTWTTLDRWVGRPLDAADDAAVEGLVVRYLAAFGPATIQDIQTWSWLTGLRRIFDRVRAQLVTFRDEDGRERFDLPDAPRPDEDVPVPPRFLPEYDNILLSHRDRRHVIPTAVAQRLTGFVGTFLVDGFVAGQWRVDAARDRATLVLEPFVPLAPADRDALVDEAGRLLAWHAPEATQRVVEFGAAWRPPGRR